MREIFTNAYWTPEDKPKPKTKLQQYIDDKIFGKAPIKFISSRTVAERVINILEEMIDELIKEKEKLRENDDYDELYFEAKIDGIKEVKEMLK